MSTFFRTTHTKDDYFLLGELRAKIDEIKISLIDKSEKKNKLTGKVTVGWICCNGHGNLFDNENCHQCLGDQYGFSKEKPISAIIQDVDQLLEALKEVFE